jgi:putative cell wall-binding protein
VTHTYTVSAVVVPDVLDVVVVGGSAAVSDGVVAQLAGLVSGSVTRVSGANRYATAAAVSKAQFAPGVPSVFVATGENFPDALAAGAPAGLADSPILLVRAGSVPSETAAELVRLKPARIYVVGGSAVVSDSVLAQLDAFTSGPVVRVAGSNRYATAAAVSGLLFKPGVGVAYVATGENFPDALAGGPAGVVGGGPILLTRQGALPGETAAELARLKPARIVVLGGTAAVSSTVAGELAAYTSGSVSRYAGSDRYATAAAVSQGVFPAGAKVVFVATGINFPDALAAGPAAGIYGGPILLDAGGSSLPAATAAEITRLGK